MAIPTMMTKGNTLLLNDVFSHAMRYITQYIRKVPPQTTPRQNLPSSICLHPFFCKSDTTMTCRKDIREKNMPSACEKVFSSGTDALLLAAFALPYAKKIHNFVELGCGDGFIACALACTQPHLHGAAFDIHAASIKSAREQCRHHALEDRLFFHAHDIQDTKKLQELCPKNIQAVVANPPYYPKHTGRQSTSSRKNQALRQEPNTLKIFCSAANAVLDYHGYFFLIYPPRHILQLIEHLQCAGFGIRRLLPVFSKVQLPALRILVEARKGAANDIRWESGFVLHCETHAWSQEARDFCPWL